MLNNGKPISEPERSLTDLTVEQLEYMLDTKAWERMKRFAHEVQGLNYTVSGDPAKDHDVIMQRRKNTAAELWGLLRWIDLEMKELDK